MTAAARSPDMSLCGLLAGFAAVDAANDCHVSGLALDSRRVQAGDLFFACRGSRSHGNAFVADAIRAGAVAVAVEAGDAAAVADAGVPVVAVDQLAEKVGPIAARFFGDPSTHLKMIGVTGTNGKTSCSQFLAQALHSNAAPCGVIGTIGSGLCGDLLPSSHTTPDAIALQALLARMHDLGARHVVMEVSSHGLEQKRVSGVAFDVALLTNLSRDHLDYHGDMAAYALAKRRLFESPGLRWAVLNLDDALGRVLFDTLPASLPRIGYTLAGAPTVGQVVQGVALNLHGGGLEMMVRSPWGEGRLQSTLLGRFNAANLLGTLAALLALEVPLDVALARLAAVQAPAGRMERFGGDDQPLVVVDYAHTPDALEQVLETLREHCRGTLWCVFGCGGDRDRGKRPQMAEVAERIADRVVVTDDNPRHEDPARITADILAGMARPSDHCVERDRAAAITGAIAEAGAGDVVLVAGKGHEDYQIIGDERRHFSDREVVAAALKGRAS